MDTYLLGIDCGTSVVKSVLFDTSGREVAAVRRDMPLAHPAPGYVEADMRLAWDAVEKTIREVLITAREPHIAAVGISGTACGFWGIDADGNPVRDAILWNDGRAADVVAGWQASGFYRQVFDISGNGLFPGYPLATLRWLKDNEPETLAKTRWLLFHKDWIRYMLTGVVYSDVSDVSYFPGDIRAGQYVPDMLRQAGLEDCIDKLPPVAPSYQIVGRVSENMRVRTGLEAGIPVAAGSVDVVASLLGGGVYRTGQACSVLGTSLLNTLISDEPTFQPPDVGVQALLPENRFARSLVNTSGTLCIDWMVEHLAGEEVRAAQETGRSVYDLIESAVKTVPPGSRGVMFLPYLNTGGVISPFADANARGMFFGMSAETIRVDLLRAVYEGVALAMRDCFAVVDKPVEEILLVGGGARSAFWAQLFADVTGKRIVIPDGTEFGARGAAILAGLGAGVFPSIDAAMQACVRIDRSFAPNPDMTRVYDALYPLYRHLYTNARQAWQLRRDFLKMMSH